LSNVFRYLRIHRSLQFDFKIRRDRKKERNKEIFFRETQTMISRKNIVNFIKNANEKWLRRFMTICVVTRKL